MSASSASVQPFALAPGEGTAVANPVGGVLTFKVTSGQSDGRLTAFDTVAAPGEGPPLHVHPDQDEHIYVLDGSFRVKLGNELIPAAPGAFVFISRGTPHTWQNIGDTPARFFSGLVPAASAFEEFFMRYSELPPDQRDTEAFARIAAATNAFDVLGPPLGVRTT